MKLSELKPVAGSRKKRKLLGRGKGTGLGQTAGRGVKGQKARSGAPISPAFEGGQMPIHRRLPKVGFKNPFRTEYAVVNLSAFADVPEKTLVDIEFLRAKRLIRNTRLPVKVLGFGDISKPLTFKVHKVSKSAKEKIEKAGGTVEVL